MPLRNAVAQCRCAKLTPRSQLLRESLLYFDSADDGGDQPEPTESLNRTGRYFSKKSSFLRLDRAKLSTKLE